MIAVCIYRYVITFGLRSKYDVLGHYFIYDSAAIYQQVQYDVTLLCYIAQLYCMQRFNFFSPLICLIFVFKVTVLVDLASNKF